MASGYYCAHQLSIVRSPERVNDVQLFLVRTHCNSMRESDLKVFLGTHELHVTGRRARKEVRCG